MIMNSKKGTKLWQVASGKWQVASGKWQVASFLGLWLIVKQKLKINDGCHCEEALADAAIQKDNYLAKAGLLRLRLAMTTSLQSAFTLVELSIVLVIIGLIVGGVLTGQDLINAATIRAQISQIEKYNTAVHTFQLKYGYLPGDIPDPAASAFGFYTRGTNSSICGGNGTIEGGYSGSTCSGVYQKGGETIAFWADLSVANLIDWNVSNVNWTKGAILYTQSFTVPNSAIWPNAAIGKGNYVYVWSGGIGNGNCNNCEPVEGGIIWPAVQFTSDYLNYFGISVVTNNGDGTDFIESKPGINVAQAYNIDNKIDDGLPLSGKVIATYVNGLKITYAAGGGNYGEKLGTAASATSNTCYDNGGNASVQMNYSTKLYPNNLNCALSFKFQ